MSETEPNPARPMALGRWRRVAVVTIIVSLAVTAVVGIVAILLGNFSDVQGRVMLTTLLIGIVSILALCDLAGLDRAYRWLSTAGLVVTTIALVTGLIVIWWDYDGPDPLEIIWKGFGIAGVAAVSCAHASLLLMLGKRTNRVVRVGLLVTIGLIAVLFALLSALILTDGNLAEDAYIRLVGTVAILDVLGTIVVPVVALFLRDRSPAAVSRADRAVPDAIESELRLLDPATRSDVAAVDALLAEDFTQIGTSGRLWSRTERLAAIAGFDPSTEPEVVADMEGIVIGRELVLLRYVSGAPGQLVRRSSVWRFDGEGWRIVFHQGTST